MSDDLLALAALDEQDLEIISAHMQDALLKVGDIKYLPKQKTLALVASRYDWQRHADTTANSGSRRQCGLLINRVSSVRSHRIRQGARNAVLSLLSLKFEPGEETPEGAIELIFSGGGLMRLEVECVEARLNDLGRVWQTAKVPKHDENDAAG